MCGQHYVEKIDRFFSFGIKNGWYRFFSEAMSRNRFCKITQFLRFDMPNTRLSRLQTDKYVLISTTWNKLVRNSIACYKPGENITVDKHLFPTEVCRRFTQHMANKPNKLGIKFWLAVDGKSKYILNFILFLGKDETRAFYTKKAIKYLNYSFS